MLDLAYRVAHRVENPEVIGAVLRRAIKLAIGIDSRVAPIGRGQVVKVRRRSAPIPQGQHDVALDPLRPRRLPNGSAPLAILSVQSPKYWKASCGSSRLIVLTIEVMA